MAGYDIDSLVRDPDFQRRPFGERKAILREADADGFGKLPGSAQSRMLVEMKGQDWWKGGKPQPTEYSPAETEQMRRKFVADEGTLLTRAKEALPSRQTLANIARPTLEAGGAVGGGIIGAAGGALAGLGIGSIPGATVGGVTGAGLGYAMGKNIADNIEGTAGGTAGQMTARTLKDIGTGAAFEMGGQIAAKVIPPAVGGTAKFLGKATKPLLGRLSGTGTGAVEEAIASGMQPTNSINPLKSTTTYDKALRGKISGEDIVESARTALTRLKDARTSTYQGHLQQIAQNSAPIDLRPVKGEVVSLMQKYNVKIDPATGALDTSRIAMGKTGRNDIQEIIETVSAWGTKQGDNTALGLDTLKRQLDDFYSDSSQARQFVTQLRNKVKDTIVANVPQYDEMTKGYTEATKIIKDVEAGLMLRKQGMSGRIVADQTLRRLMSAMKDNFALRRELVDILGKEGGEELGQAIAGYAHNSVMPVGLAGTGPAIIGSAAVTRMVDPSFGALMAASSPRVQGEFLRMWGKGMKGAVASKQVIKPLAVTAATMADN